MKMRLYRAALVREEGAVVLDGVLVDRARRGVAVVVYKILITTCDVNRSQLTLLHYTCAQKSIRTLKLIQVSIQPHRHKLIKKELFRPGTRGPG